jgi:predicted ATP-binding protein involved in virulence
MLGNDIQIQQLVGVGDVHLSLAPDQRVYCLIGENGIGKTKCLEALFIAGFCSHEISNKWVSRLRTISHPKFNKLSSMNIGVEFGFNDGAITNKNPLQTLKSIHNLALVYVPAYSRGYIEDSIEAIQKRENGEINSFETRRDAYIERISEILKGYKSFKSGLFKVPVHEWIIQRAQSANPYKAKEDNREVEITTLLALLNKVDERIDAKFLEISVDNRVFIKVAEKKTELSELSSGFASLLKIMQSIIAGYSYFTNETNIAQVKGVVFIDEIESHLHTKWQAKIIPTLKDLFPNTTFYITTHSAIVISQLQQGEAYELYRDDSDDIVKSKLINHPNNSAFVDLLKDAFDVDINRLKLDRDNAPQQAQAKKALLSLIDKKLQQLEEMGPS